MSLDVRSAHIKSLDIRKDDHGSVVLAPDFSCKSDVTGTGREPNALNITNILKICGSCSFREVIDVPVRIMFHKCVLIAIGHHSTDNWCHLPSGGKMLSLDKIKELEKEKEVEYLPI